MQYVRTLRAIVLMAMIAICIAPPVMADIKSFNAAMAAKDYSKAASEAASTWPTLDKARKDIAVIAREFGFAAYMAKDYGATRTYGEAAATMSKSLNEDAYSQASSEVLLRLAEHKTAPTDATRDKLYVALSAAGLEDGIDLISYFGADVITSYDFDRGDWKDAAASAAVGLKLAGQGGPVFLVQTYRFGLFKSVAEFMITRRNVKSYEDLTALEAGIIESIDSAASDADASELVKLYWGIRAWRNTIDIALENRQKMPPDSVEKGAADDVKSLTRAKRLLDLHADDESCRAAVDMRRTPSYPSSARYKGLIGVVILRLDTDAAGVASKPEILAAVPAEPFGAAVLKVVKDIRYTPHNGWSGDCSLARTGRVLTFQFSIG